MGATRRVVFHENALNPAVSEIRAIFFFEKDAHFPVCGGAQASFLLPAYWAEMAVRLSVNGGAYSVSSPLLAQFVNLSLLEVVTAPGIRRLKIGVNFNGVVSKEKALDPTVCEVRGIS